MRTSYLASLVFGLLAGTSLVANAMPASSASASPSPIAAVAPAEQSGKVSINSANAETLQKELNGVGAAKAAAIVAYRDENGSFTSVDELIEVRGIGKAILDKNRDKLSLD